MDNCPHDVFIHLDFLWGRDEDIFGNAHGGKFHADLDGLFAFRPGYGHHDQQVYVAIAARGSPGVRAEEDDPLRVEARDNALDHLPDDRLDAHSSR